MLRRVYGWLLAAGVILILAGIVVLVRLDSVDSANSAGSSAGRARLVEAIVDLQDCFCHDALADASLLAHHADHAAVMVANLSAHPETSQHAAANARLVSAGQRILALPAASGEPSEAVIRGFLQIYDQTRLGSPTGETLAALDQLEFWLGMLENQAQPTRWSRASAMPQPPDESAWQAVSLVSRDYSAADEFGEPVPDVTHLFIRLNSEHRAVLHADAVWGIHHRGPPAGAPMLWV